MSDLQPRPYQHEAVSAIMRGWDVARRQLAVMPTGTGKTVVFAKVAEAVRPQGRTLILAHREELLQQAIQKIDAWTALTTDLEQGSARALPMIADVVVASVPTLARKARRECYAPDAFTLIVIDEAHHAPAESYQAIVNYFNARVLGVTATPERLDRKALAGTFDHVPFVYELRDAIQDGWLVPIRQKIARVRGLDLSAVRTIAGDFHERDLEAAVIGHEVPAGVARATVEAAGDRKTLVFATTVAHARILAIAFQQFVAPDRVAVVTGEDAPSERRATLARFAEGQVQYLLNCMLLTEGYDQPDVACVAMARPTKSRLLYTQMIGRGTRTAPGKRDLLVIDYAGNAGRHALISAVDILGGEDRELKDRIMAKASAADGCDVLEELRRQQEELAEFHRRQAMEAAQRAQAAQVTVEFVEVDPFRRVYSILKVRPVAGRMGGIEPTAEQLERLREYKVDMDMPLQDLDRGQAAEIIARIQERPRLGLCTYKQARTLLRFGYDPDMKFQEARAIITQLAANGWRRGA